MLKKLIVFSVLLLIFQLFAKNSFGFDAIDSLVGNTYDNYQIKNISRNENTITVQFADKNDEVELEMSTNDMSEDDIIKAIKEIIMSAREDILAGYDIDR